MATPARDRALDAARGLAVVGMVWSHYVPVEDAAHWLGRVAAFGTEQAEGKTAALFCLLAGMGWALHEHRSAADAHPWRYVVRRCLAMLGLGLLVGTCLWPTEILMPLGLMFAATTVLLRMGTTACLVAAFACAAAVPWVTEWLGHHVEQDWLDDGTPRVWSSFGAVTLRYFLFDGNYPLLPWLCFPLVGAALASVEPTADRCRRWFARALPLALVMSAAGVWTAEHATGLGGLAAHLQSTWVPTSVPFLVQNLAWAVTCVAGLGWWQARSGLGRRFEVLVLLGRASLTHYLLHLLLVYAPLRISWPDADWDWSMRTGVLLTLGYFVVTVPLTVWWFRRHRRGPLEALLTRISTGSR